MLLAAMAQPESNFARNYLHSDIYSMAGAYLYHIAMNHPFVDGNKRVATVSALIFLEINDHELDVDENLLEEIVLKVAGSKLSKEKLIEFFRAYTKQIK